MRRRGGDAEPRAQSRRSCGRAAESQVNGARDSAFRFLLRQVALTAATIACLSPLFVAQVVGHAADAAPCPTIDSKTQLPASLSYLVPPGYADTSHAGDAEAYLVAPSIGNVRESITFVPDDPPTDVTGDTTTTVAGLPSFVVTDVALGGQFGTFERDVVLQCGQGIQFRVDCRGLPGYDPALMADSCQRFLASLTFPPGAAVGERACPSISPGRGEVTTIACSIPDGYHVVSPKLTEGITLASPATNDIQERIDLSRSPPATTPNYEGHTRITVGDCPAYVMSSTSSTTAYLQQVVLDCGTSERYSIQCQGNAQSCASFLASLHTVSVTQSTQGPTAGALPVSLAVAYIVVVGVFLFALIRLVSWAWPQVFGLELLELVWSTALGRVVLLLVVALSAAGIATQFPVLGAVALAFWTVVLVAFGLEVLYRTTGRRFVPVAKRHRGPKPQGLPERAVNASASARAAGWQSTAGYGRRTQTMGPTSSGPAYLLHPRPSSPIPGRSPGTVPSESPLPAPASILHSRPGAAQLQASPYGSSRRGALAEQLLGPAVLRLLQVVVVVQGVLGVLGGVNILRSDSALSALPSFGAPISVTGELNNVGIATIVLSALVIVAAIRISGPAPASRLFLVVWELAAVAASVGVLIKYVVPLQLRDAFIVVISAAGMEFLHPVLALTIALVALVGILVPRSLREGLPQ